MIVIIYMFDYFDCYILLVFAICFILETLSGPTFSTIEHKHSNAASRCLVACGPLWPTGPNLVPPSGVAERRLQTLHMEML